MKRSLTYFVVILFCVADSAFAAEQCPAIDCDCDSLPNSQWLEVCKQHEIRIKRQCVANSNTPRDYCSIHGLNAKPLPLAIKFNEFHVDETVDVDTLKAKVSALYWEVKSNAEEAKESFDNGDFPRTMQILKLTDPLLDSLFGHQQKVEAAYLARVQDNIISTTWKDYSDSTLEHARFLDDFGVEIASRIGSAGSAREKKIYSVLAKKSLRLAGKAYEHSGFASARAGKEKKSAEVWKMASGVSARISGINKLVGAKKEVIKYSELQTAARLHRASYHYLMANQRDESTKWLKRSQMFVNREEHRYIDNLVNALEKNDPDGVLSGR